MKRLTNAVCEVLVAWPIVAAIWTIDKVTGQVTDLIDPAGKWARDSAEDEL